MCRKLVQIDAFQESDWSEGMALMNLVIREGKSWPFESEFHSLEAFRAYFLSHAALCVKNYPATNDEEGEDSGVHGSNSQKLLGCFYIKPNFPGRCGHVCNGGFITAPAARRIGVGNLMGRTYLLFARDLGYKSSYFNLVFASNCSSVRLWETLGFQRVATLPKAARLRGLEGYDTAYGYHYDLETLPLNYLSPFVVTSTSELHSA
jgi:GNAT superfamily N-acetyltransferase